MSTPGRRPLDRDRIVDAAVALADRDGLDAVTMRRLGDRLDVTPMAVYKHVTGREELIDAMLDRVVASIPPARSGASWRDATRDRVLTARAALRSHPWARDAIETRRLASPTVLAYLDSLMATMFDGGLSADLVHHAMHALSTRMWGFTRDVLPTPAVPADPTERARAMATFAVTYPAIVRMATTAQHAGAGCDEDAEFAFALDLLLDGVQRRHDDGWSPAVAAARR
ncbi:TetR/AcrR family transcriptional regulator C-terminal domain-containing protein [Miniimonas sp. S16]|uniref:TetR/AcrR family transcriptional regulator C-terminal domain-containing protein n=1 Tax=Miniimonas sp. S16 TaxID=2171623 RepID=UPI000D5289A2|nr:TetR/AcrR family transcriptional regulator C-terminal domain-containing protein [Miniimonas sp. S16]